MAIGSLFKSGSRDLLQRIQARDFQTGEEKRSLYEELASSNQIKTADVIPMLFSPDAQLRGAVGKLLGRRADPQTMRLYLGSSTGRPDGARRAALSALVAVTQVNAAGQLGQLLGDADAELRKLASSAVLDLPVSRETGPYLQHIVKHGEATQRLRAVTALATIATASDLGLFRGLVADPDERIRLAAYGVVVRHATADDLPTMIKRIGEESYATQQVLIEGLQRLVPQGGGHLIDEVLGLLASGNTGLRTAAIKVLLSLPDRVDVVRRFIAYTKGLAGWVRDRTLDNLREFGPEVLEPALELMRDADSGVRSTALTLIAGIDDPRVVRATMALLKDDDWWVAINAADLLGKWRKPESVDALIEAIGREELRWAAVDALGHVGGPRALQVLAELTQDSRGDIRIEALAGLALSDDPRVIEMLEQSAKTDPAKWVRSRALDLLRDKARRRNARVSDATVRAAVESGAVAADGPEIHRLLSTARRQGASDLHISVDSPPIMRQGGELKRMDGEPLTDARTKELLESLLSPEQAERLRVEQQVDACFFVPNDGRYRGNLFVDRKGLNGVFRVIPEQPPTVTELGLPAIVTEIASIHQGIIIVTGPAGSGKSTTLAALVNLVNEVRRAHILTLEDPVEFVHPFKSSLINQRDISKHSQSFARALRAALREDPDVIVIGELRDGETVKLALDAAETGHVVLTTLNATTAAKALDRIVSSFPADEQSQIRESFAGSLKLCLAQSLVPAKDGKSRVACFEILRATHAVASLIRDNKTYQIPSLMQIGQTQGMRTFDEALMELVRQDKISAETAYMKATSRAAFEHLVSATFLEGVQA